MDGMTLTMEYLLRIILGALCGIAIGFERKNHFKVAGVKTHMIVGLSAALIMIVSKYGFSDVETYDAARVAAQIVSGVGFLGAGIIFKRDQTVQGLTTAAGIWATAGVGMALGAGLYSIGILGTLIFIVMHMFVQKNEAFQNGLQRTFLVEVDQNIGSISKVLDFCEGIKKVNYSLCAKETSYQLEVTLVFLNEIQQEEWVKSILDSAYLMRLDRY